MLRDTFNELANDFNTAADKAIKTDASPALLLTRYSAIIRYKAQSTDEKEAVASMLFKKGLELLNSFATNDSYLSDSRRVHAANAKNYAQAIFNRLLEPDSLPYLPEHSAEQLADATIALAKRADGVTRDTFRHSYHPDSEANEYKKALTALADLSLGVADKYTATKTAATAAVMGQKIAPAARLQLRQPGEG
jgi:hypothetical protein